MKTSYYKVQSRYYCVRLHYYNVKSHYYNVKSHYCGVRLSYYGVGTSHCKDGLNHYSLGTHYHRGEMALLRHKILRKQTSAQSSSASDGLPEASRIRRRAHPLFKHRSEVSISQSPRPAVFRLTARGTVCDKSLPTALRSCPKQLFGSSLSKVCGAHFEISSSSGARFHSFDSRRLLFAGVSPSGEVCSPNPLTFKRSKPVQRLSA
jgi:hypothetical protein